MIEHESETDRWIVGLYQRGCHAKDIAAVFDCSHTLIRTRLQRAGVLIRGRAVARSPRLSPAVAARRRDFLETLPPPIYPRGWRQ